MSQKHTQSIPRPVLRRLLAIARGDEKASVVIKDVHVLDLVNGELFQTSIALEGEWIAGIGSYEGHEVIDANGLYIVPGFIDSHTHIESSMMHPFEFERQTLPLGTTTVVCDPHELTNVIGKIGVEWFLRCSNLMTQNLFVQIPSCVPSLPGLETNGAHFSANEMVHFKNHPHVLGLAEMMNYPGVIYGQDDVLDKLDTFQGSHLDGHAPTLGGKLLNAYRVAGIENCHESISAAEAKEKLRIGMAVMLREGSVAKNLKTIAPLVHEFNSSQCLLCTDDRNPLEISAQGHINYLLKRLMTDHSIPPHVAYRLSSYAAAKHFNLKRVGLIAPGYRADFVLLKNLQHVDIETVYCRGRPVFSTHLTAQLPEKLSASRPPLHNTINRPLTSAADFKLSLTPGVYNVIEIIPGQLTTLHSRLQYDGQAFEEQDVIPIHVIERYGHNSPVSHGLVKGMGLKCGAIASTVAHDSHNIIVIGTTPEDVSVAVNTLIQNGGGLVAVNEQNVLSTLPLPIGGLMSLQSSYDIAQNIDHLKNACYKLGVTIHEPFLQMAFLSLPVIPSLKITDKGLVDVTTFKLIPLKED